MGTIKLQFMAATRTHNIAPAKEWFRPMLGEIVAAYELTPGEIGPDGGLVPVADGQVLFHRAYVTGSPMTAAEANRWLCQPHVETGAVADTRRLAHEAAEDAREALFLTARAEGRVALNSTFSREAFEPVYVAHRQCAILPGSLNPAESAALAADRLMVIDFARLEALVSWRRENVKDDAGFEKRSAR
jgi:hypothetical protein